MFNERLFRCMRICAVSPASEQARDSLNQITNPVQGHHLSRSEHDGCLSGLPRYSVLRPAARRWCKSGPASRPAGVAHNQGRCGLRHRQPCHEHLVRAGGYLPRSGVQRLGLQHLPSDLRQGITVDDYCRLRRQLAQSGTLHGNHFNFKKVGSSEPSCRQTAPARTTPLHGTRSR